MANALIVHPGPLVLSPERAKRAAQCINVWGLSRFLRAPNQRLTAPNGA